MLERCRDDDRVASISGDCFLPERMQDGLTAEAGGALGAYRSKYFNMWGWATWSDRWEGYSLKLDDRSAEDWDAVIERVHGATLEASVWRAILMALRSEILDTWDFQFAFHSWARGRGHGVPTAKPWSTNLGFDSEATHTVDVSPVAGLARQEFGRLDVGGELKEDEELDGLTFYLRHLEGLKLTLWLKEGFLIDDQDRSERIRSEKQLVELQRACHERMGIDQQDVGADSGAGERGERAGSGEEDLGICRLRISDFGFGSRRRSALERVARAMGVKGRVVGDPVMVGLLEWWAAGGKGDVVFPPVVAGGRGGRICRGMRWRWRMGCFRDLRRWCGGRCLRRSSWRWLIPRGGRGVLPSVSPGDAATEVGGGPGCGATGDRLHHVPKCAGMSMFHHLNAHLSWNDELVHLDGRARADVLAAGVVPFEWKDERELARIEVLFGHDVSLASAGRLAGREVWWVTCLRDPVARMVSHYNWEMHQRDLAGRGIPTFDDWAAAQGKNWMTRWLGRVVLGWDVNGVEDRAIYERVAATLETFWILGMTEDYSEATRPVTEFLGLPAIGKMTNVAGEAYPKRAEVTPEITDRMRADQALDFELVERWRVA